MRGKISTTLEEVEKSCRERNEINRKQIMDMKDRKVDIGYTKVELVKEIDGIKKAMEHMSKEIIILKKGDLTTRGVQGEQAKEEIRKEIEGIRKEMANMGKEQGERRDIMIGSGKIKEIESKIEDMKRERRKRNLVVVGEKRPVKTLTVVFRH